MGRRQPWYSSRVAAVATSYRSLRPGVRTAPKTDAFLVAGRDVESAPVSADDGGPSLPSGAAVDTDPAAAPLESMAEGAAEPCGPPHGRPAGGTRSDRHAELGRHQRTVARDTAARFLEQLVPEALVERLDARRMGDHNLNGHLP